MPSSERSAPAGWATVGTDGPHVTALWFVWHRESVWLTSMVRSQRWTDVAEGPPCDGPGRCR